MKTVVTHNALGTTFRNLSGRFKRLEKQSLAGTEEGYRWRVNTHSYVVSYYNTASGAWGFINNGFVGSRVSQVAPGVFRGFKITGIEGGEWQGTALDTSGL